MFEDLRRSSLCPQSLRVRPLRSSVHTHSHADSSSESPFSWPSDEDGSCPFIESTLERTGPCSGLLGSRGNGVFTPQTANVQRRAGEDLSSQSTRQTLWRIFTCVPPAVHTQFFTLLRGFPYQSYRSALICFTLLKSLALPYQHFPCFREYNLIKYKSVFVFPSEGPAFQYLSLPSQERVTTSW